MNRGNPAREGRSAQPPSVGRGAKPLPSFGLQHVLAESELAELKHWLEKRWNATPRDTAMLKKLLKLIPGGERLTAWSEAAPYLDGAVQLLWFQNDGRLEVLDLREAKPIPRVMVTLAMTEWGNEEMGK